MTGCAAPVDLRGWSAYRLGNEFVQLVAVPEIGGRIMAYAMNPPMAAK